MSNVIEDKRWEEYAKDYFDRWEDKELVQLVATTITELVENEKPKDYLKTAKNIVSFYNSKGYITAKQKWALSIFASKSNTDSDSV